MRPGGAQAPAPQRTRWGAVVAVALMVFMSGLDMTIVAVALPDLAADLGVSPGAAQLTTLAYLVPVLLLMLPAGRWVDSTDRRRALLLVVAGFGASSVLVSLAGSLATALGARMLQGVFAAAVGALSFAVIAAAVRPDHRGRAQALVATLGPLGSVAGPGVGGALVDVAGWRAVFLMNIPVCVLAGWLATAVPSGAVAGRAAPSLRQFGALLRGRVLVAGLLVLLAGTVVTGADNALLPFLLQDSWGQSPTLAGAVLLVLPAVMVLTAPAGGWLADRFGPARVQCAGAAVLVAGTALLLAIVAGAGSHSAPAAVAGALAVTGLASGLLMGPNAAVLMAAAPDRWAGSVGAVAGLVRNAGFALGPALAALSWKGMGDGVSGTVTGLAVAAGAAGVALVAAAVGVRVRSTAAGSPRPAPPPAAPPRSPAGGPRRTRWSRS